MLKSVLTIAAFVVGAALAVMPAMGQADQGHMASAGDLTIVHAWARAAAAGGTSLVFLEIENAGAPDRLLGGEAALAEAVAVVGLSIAGAEVVTEEVGAVEIASGAFALDPGGLALALRGLRQALVEGERVDLTVQFERAGPITIDVAIVAADASQHPHAGHDH